MENIKDVTGNYNTLTSIVEQLELCGYVTADTNHELKDNAAFKALKELAALENNPKVMPTEIPDLIEEINFSQEPQEMMKNWRESDLITLRIPRTGLVVYVKRKGENAFTPFVARPLAIISDKIRIGILK